MPTAVLYRSTRAGTIELAVSERTAANTEVARSAEWGREWRPETADEWAARLRKVEEARQKREARRREREREREAEEARRLAELEGGPNTPEEWTEWVRLRNDADRKQEERRREREAPMSDIGTQARTVVEPFPLDPDEVAIEARREPAAWDEKQDQEKMQPPNAGAWFLLRVRDRVTKGRGSPGYGGSPATKGCGE